MPWEMKPFTERSPDSQYQDRLRFILDQGELIKETPQGAGAITVFGKLPDMVFDLKNGAPLITERRVAFWKKAVTEIFAFVNGVRKQSELVALGCDWWKYWVTPEKAKLFGLEPDDLGPGSYGVAFHDFPTPNGPFNQYAHLINQIRNYPEIRTFRITPWIPDLIGRGGHQKAVVSPCHGWQHYRVINGRLDLVMTQHSADFPIGVPANMIQYSALLMAVAHVTGYEPGTFIHKFTDAHVYDNQTDGTNEMIAREPRRLPTLTLVDPPDDLFAFRAEHFALSDYDSHPAMNNIPVLV